MDRSNQKINKALSRIARKRRWAKSFDLGLPDSDGRRVFHRLLERTRFCYAAESVSRTRGHAWKLPPHRPNRGVVRWNFRNLGGNKGQEVPARRNHREVVAWKFRDLVDARRPKIPHRVRRQEPDEPQKPNRRPHALGDPSGGKERHTSDHEHGVPKG